MEITYIWYVLPWFGINFDVTQILFWIDSPGTLTLSDYAGHFDARLDVRSVYIVGIQPYRTME